MKEALQKLHNVRLAPLQLLLVIFLIFSLARYAVDGMILEVALRSQLRGVDFQVYYLAAEMLRRGENIYDFERVKMLVEQHPTMMVKLPIIFGYPPLLPILLTPLSYLSVPWAYRLWIFVLQMFLLAAVGVLHKSLPSLGQYGWIYLILLGSHLYPLYVSLDLGQINPLILLCFCLALYFSQRARFFWAGVAIGFGAMIKLSPLLLIGWFVWQRRWQAVGGALLAIGLLTLLTWGIAGSHNMIAFVTQGLAGTFQEYTQLNNIAPTALIHRLLGASAWADWESWVQRAWMGLCLIVLSWVSRTQHAHDSLSFAGLFAVWVTATHLISPVTWQHHLILLWLPFSVMLAIYLSHSERFSFGFVIWLGGLYTCIAFENLILTRFGGWGVAYQNYWHDYLFVDLRLFAILGVFCSLLFMLRTISSPSHTVSAKVSLRKV